MEPFLVSEIVDICKGELLQGWTDSVFKGIGTDSRTVTSGELFIPLKGEKFDGHDFINKAFESGAAGALVGLSPNMKESSGFEDCQDRDHRVYEICQKYKICQKYQNRVLILVNDAQEALGMLAAAYRRKFVIPVVAVTGSVGKTSTKDMIASILAGVYRVHKTDGNYNNEIGLPLTIFKMGADTETAVFEMGMSARGEIYKLSLIAAPTMAVITNIGISHIEKLGSLENILSAKLEIIDGMDKNGIIILNGDDTLLSKLKGNLSVKTVFAGTQATNDYRGSDIRLFDDKVEFNITVRDKVYQAVINIPGAHNVNNALLAFAAGCEVGLDPGLALHGLATFSSGKMRMNIKKANGFTIIDDTYNASPQSVRAALQVLADMESGRKTAVLGDMLELGSFGPDEHYIIGKFAAESAKIDFLITAGPLSHNTARGALEAGMAPQSVFSFDSSSEAALFAYSFLKHGDMILVKGSRGMEMEKVIEKLTYNA
ncbi:MAG: UDP-N-acetylmuramoyl-tripeptide--D-alanyl-D-alanine ligase [Clostridiales bacterium]|nr:UDP-N-acetylmuramoyl-tripeptide--D-alanyl-D-alanine ligase [Clostridiales bacterium]